MPSQMSSGIRPIIATARLNDEAFHYFNELRQRHFPPERNFIDAHLTLYHHLPGEDPDVVEAAVREASGDASPLPGRVDKPIFLGKGVAYHLAVPGLSALRHRIGEPFELTPQDQQKLRPHVTVQNKVDPGVAKMTMAHLEAKFEPFDATVVGVDLWFYEGGPWSPMARIDL